MKKIFLLGDSIRMGYDEYVAMAFRKTAKVFYPEDNCRFAAYFLRNLKNWQKELECGEDVDLIHWNAGLWDLLILQDGEHLTPVEVYAMYIERICKMMKQFFPNAKMIFATSTPVQEELFTEYKRFNRDIENYNAHATAIVKRYGMEVNDLYTLACNSPVEYHSDKTHYGTKEGTRMLADQVVAVISKSLAIEAESLDYDTLFAE